MKLIIYGASSSYLKNFKKSVENKDLILQRTVSLEKLKKELSSSTDVITILDLDKLNKTRSKDPSYSLSTITELRSLCKCPIILISDNDDTMNKILSLNAGADDYILKSASIDELLARINAQIRRYTGNFFERKKKTLRTSGGLTLDEDSKKVFVDGVGKDLTPIEFNIVKMLISLPGTPHPSNEIYSAIWKLEAFDADNIIAVHVRHIRQKIEKDPAKPSLLKLVKGQGYLIA